MTVLVCKFSCLEFFMINCLKLSLLSAYYILKTLLINMYRDVQSLSKISDVGTMIISLER